MELSYLRLKVNGLLIGWLQASIDDETAQNSGHALQCAPPDWCADCDCDCGKSGKL